MSNPMWMVRASGRSAGARAFVDRSIVALGVGREFGGVPEYDSPDDLYEVLRRSHPSWRPGRHRAVAAQLHCFLREMQAGDHVLTWDGAQRCYYLGTIQSPVRWEPDATGGQPYVRTVNWTHRLGARDLSADGRSALNVVQTLFHVGRGIAQEVISRARTLDVDDDVAIEGEEEPSGAAQLAEAANAAVEEPSVQLAPRERPKPMQRVSVEHTPIPGSLHAIRPDATQVVVEFEDGQKGAAPPTHSGIRAPELPPSPAAAGGGSHRDATSLAVAARQRIEARLAALGTDALRAVIAGVLQARGYPRRSVDSETGADLFAGADLLGRNEPALRVQVLGDGRDPVTADQVSAALEGRSSNERWILLAAEGFTRDARTAAEGLQAGSARCTLLDSVDLARLVLRHYDELDLATRALVPLVRVWWPAWEEKP